MKRSLILTTALAISLVALTACGPTSSVVDGAPPSTSAPDDVPTTPAPLVAPPDTTVPPSAPPTAPPAAPPTAPPAAPPPTTVPRSPRPATTVDVVIDDGSFESVDEMGDVASLIVVGEVVGVTSLGRPFLDRDPNANEFVAITVRVAETLKGEAGAEIVLGWQAFANDANGHRTATLVTNGLQPPDVADRLVLFLDEADPAMNEVLGGATTHQLVKLDGIAYLDSDRPVAAEVGSPAAEQLVTMSLAEIRNTVAA